MKTAWLFPGQGAQQVGMGKDLCDASAGARAVFEQAEAATALAIRELCFRGPDEQLARTDVCQPAIFTVSAATLAVMREVLGADRFAALRPAFAAGLSLGEYSALYAADAIDLAPAVSLVARRGQLMQQAATATASGMVSVIGLDEPAAQALVAAAARGEPLTCANFNCPGQIVLSGSLAACERVEQLAAQHGAKGAVRLNVAGAFHSQIMAPAAEGLARALAGLAFRTPAVPVVANVDAQVYADGQAIPPKLIAQLTGAVRWQQTMELLESRGVQRYYEIGPGRVLAGLMRRINRRADIVSINSLQAVEELAKQSKKEK
jgi:[acyl-carrier-protein] S-malonyltransferase